MSWSSITAARPLTALGLPSRRPALALLFPLIAIAGVGAAKGGFFATSFGWTALAFALAGLFAVVLVAPRWRFFDGAWLVSATAICLFMFVSAAWAGSAEDAVDAGLRCLVYVTGMGAALLVLRRRDLEWWLTGLALGAAGICVYSLATRLLPGHFSEFDSSDYRLFEPIGYWNGLGIFGVVALLLAFGSATFGRRSALRVLAGGAMVVLAPTVYFTFSRGAWFALAVGILVALALSPQRLRLALALAVLGAMPALAALLASRAQGLTERGSTLAQASHDGRRLLLELVVLEAAQLVIGAVYVGALARAHVPSAVSRLFGVFLVAVAIAGLAAVFARYGSPLTIARHVYDGFLSGPAGGSDLNGRLLSLSNDGRTVLWHAAWRDFTAHPLVGSGAGSYGAWWLAHRTTTYFVEDAHNLYVQSLAEVGVVGTCLLLAFLAIPIVAALRARRNPLVATTLGAYVAFLVHAAYDWDWQLPAVTLLALFGGAALVAAARQGDGPPPPMGSVPRSAIGIAIVAAAGVAFVGLVGNIALSASNTALLTGNGKKAAAEASKARSWAPWSSDALLDLGQGRYLEGEKRSGLAAVRAAAAKNPGDWQTWFDIAAVTRGAEHRAALARAERLNPQSPEIAAVLPFNGSG